MTPATATPSCMTTGEEYLESLRGFLHIATSPDDLVMQNKMERRLGQLTGTCFQRCVGMDAFNALHSVTFEMDERHGSAYHRRLIAVLTEVQRKNLVVGGAMTDVKGDRGKAPHQQADPDLFVHVTRRDERGIYLTGAKAHQTGCLNSHWLVVMSTMRLGPADKDSAVVGAVPVDAPGITYIYGRQSCDTRALDGEIDAGNAKFSGQEAMVVFQDVLIGAAATVADYNGVEQASHIRDKLVEMTHLDETIYGTGIAASHQATPLKSGVYLSDDMLSNVCKHHVTRIPCEIDRLAQDLAGGLMVNLALGAGSRPSRRRYADTQAKRPMTPATKFRMASHSKLFTATAIMQIREQGKLRLEPPVVAWDPAWARFAGFYRGRGGDSQVVLMNQRLVILTPNGPSAENPVRLEPMGNGLFRYVAPVGGGAVGEVVRFVEEAGRVVRMITGDSYVARVNP